MAMLIGITCIILVFPSTILSSGSFHCASETACKCILTGNNKYAADCSGLGLKSTPLFNKDVIEINLSHNQLRMFPETAKLPAELMLLDVSYNNILNFSGDINFKHIQKLQTLNISSNQLTLDYHTFRPGLFKGMPNLETLNIKDNVIKNASSYIDKTLTELTKLDTLQITGYSTKMFGTNFLHMKSLKHLDMSGPEKLSKIEYLPFDFFKYLPFLRTIDISSCGIFRIENGTFQATPYLEQLDISFNQDLTFRVLTNVTYDLQFTNIKILGANKIHHTFGTGTELFVDDLKYLSNTSLVELHVAFNRLELLEPGLINILPKSLRYISAGQNRFTFGQYVFDLGTLTGVKEINGSFQFLSNNPKDLSPINKHKSCDKPYRKECDNLLTDRKTEILDLFNQFSAFLYTSLSLQIPLPKDIERVYFRMSGLQYSLPRLEFGKNKLKYLDLSANVLNEWIGPIIGLTALEYLDLSNNYCTVVSRFFFQNSTNIKYLNIENNLLGFPLENDNGEIFKGLKQLETLNMSANRISYLRTNVFTGTVSLKYLDISNNRLKKWEFEIQHMANLTYINISNNQIRYLSKNLRKSLDELNKHHNITVSFAGNSILCNCDSLDFLTWIHDTNVLENKTQYSCEGMDGKTLRFKDLRNIISDLELTCMSKLSLIIGVTVAILISVIILIAGIIYRYRWKIRYLYYIAVTKGLGYSHKTDDGYERTYEYDIFVSYADADLAFVKNEMINKLEKDRDFRLCIHHRNFIPGYDIAANIINAIHESRKTVLIVSPDFLKSYWCRFEFNMARMESIYSRDGRNTLFLVFLQDVSVRDIPVLMLELIDSQSYIEYPNDPHGDIVFWDKIAEATRL